MLFTSACNIPLCVKRSLIDSVYYEHLPELIVVADSHGREIKFVHIRYFYIYFSRIFEKENQSRCHHIHK